MSAVRPATKWAPYTRPFPTYSVRPAQACARVSLDYDVTSEKAAISRNRPV